MVELKIDVCVFELGPETFVMLYAAAHISAKNVSTAINIPHTDIWVCWFTAQMSWLKLLKCDIMEGEKAYEITSGGTIPEP